MNPNTTVVGIDVGGKQKGFHGVALSYGRFETKNLLTPSDAANWCREVDAEIVAIDAPCAWALSGGSRFAERTLKVDGGIVQCFKTPTRASAFGRAFYDWVFRGEERYQCLVPSYALFDGTRRPGRTVLETFPQMVVCSLAGRVVPARPKSATRRGLLRELGYETTKLSSIDFVDAALCAVTAQRYVEGRTRAFGNPDEGYIVVPV